MTIGFATECFRRLSESVYDEDTQRDVRVLEIERLTSERRERHLQTETEELHTRNGVLEREIEALRRELGVDVPRETREAARRYRGFSTSYVLSYAILRIAELVDAMSDNSSHEHEFARLHLECAAYALRGVSHTPEREISQSKFDDIFSILDVVARRFKT